MRVRGVFRGFSSFDLPPQTAMSNMTSLHGCERPGRVRMKQMFLNLKVVGLGFFGAEVFQFLVSWEKPCQA